METLPLLHHRRLTAGGAPRRWIVFLHGVFGAGRNWTTIARRVTERRPDFGALLVDLRQHGSSVGFAPPHTMESAAGDVRALLEAEGLAAEAVLGHSLGGKVALVYARQWARMWAGTEPQVRQARPLRQVWVVDSTPHAYPPAGSAWEMLAVLRRVPPDFATRAEGTAALQAEGLGPEVAQWMATNLVEGEDGRWGWRIDPSDMEALLRDFFRTDAWDVVERPPDALEVHVIKAEESSILDEAACQRIEAAGGATGRAEGRVWLHRVPGGHWLNQDNPDALVELLSERL